MAACGALSSAKSALKIPHSYADIWQEEASTEIYLVSLTKALINLLNARVYEHSTFKTHLSTHIRTDMNGAVGYGIPNFISNYKVAADASPGFYTELFNESAVVDEARGTAAVLLSQDMSWYSCDGRRMAGTIVFSWERRVEGWLCNGCCMIFGTPEFLAV